MLGKEQNGYKSQNYLGTLPVATFSLLHTISLFWSQSLDKRKERCHVGIYRWELLMSESLIHL